MDLCISVLIVYTRKWNPLRISLEITQVPALKGWWCLTRSRIRRQMCRKWCTQGLRRAAEMGREHKPSIPVGPSTRLCWLSDQDRQQPDPAQGDNPYLSLFHKRNRTSPTSTRSVPMLSTSKKTSCQPCTVGLQDTISTHRMPPWELSSVWPSPQFGKCFFPNVLSFQLGTSADHKGVGALLTNQFFKNKSLLLHGKATDDKKAERMQGIDQHMLQTAVASTPGAQ